MLSARLFGFVRLVVVGFIVAGSVYSQTTAFTYQGSLKDSNLPANGTYDFIFMLFDAPTGGNNLGGPTQYFTNRQVTDGIFSFSLDFGNLFTGIPVFLEVRVGPAGTPPGQLTVLSPRQQVTSAPYAIKSVTADNSLKLGGVTANQFVQTNDSRLTDARNPLPNSTSYIQNGTVSQSGSNFNISGNGTVGGTVSGNVVNAATQYNLNGQRVLGVTLGSNLYVGTNVGTVNTTGDANTFVGVDAGRSNTSGRLNAFFGWGAGSSNTVGEGNSVIGPFAGYSLTSGDFNTIVGRSAGLVTTTGSLNSFVGSFAGLENNGGAENSYFGANAGRQNVSADFNSFFGSNAGRNTTGASNSFFGASSGQDNTTGLDNAFFGVNTGRGNTTGSRNSYFGRLAGRFLTTGDQNTAVGYGAGDNNTTGSNNTFIGSDADGATNGLTFATAIGSGAVVGSSNTIQLGRASGLDIVNLSGKIRVGSLGTGGATSLCRNASNEIATCSSSARYKSNINPFVSGLDLIRRLRPVSFEWTAAGMTDLGLVAEQVAEVEPLLTTTNEKGEVEGVKYDRVGVVLVNAVQEQQKLIDAQNEELKRLKAEIDALKQLVCAQNPNAEVCRELKP